MFPHRGEDVAEPLELGSSLLIPSAEGTSTEPFTFQDAALQGRLWVLWGLNVAPGDSCAVFNTTPQTRRQMEHRGEAGGDGEKPGQTWVASRRSR